MLRFTGDRRIFFLQNRVGRHGHTFKVIKFATIRNDTSKSEAVGAAIVCDPRIPFIGRVLRFTKINEIPQFINVLRGDMSLVGWRPLVDISFKEYPPDVRKAISYLRPGVTGIGSIFFRNEELILASGQDKGRRLVDVYRAEILPYKGALELWYARNACVSTDAKVLAATMVLLALPNWTGYVRWFEGLPDIPIS